MAFHQGRAVSQQTPLISTAEIWTAHKFGKVPVCTSPVQVPGALLALGDLHACMGDGEIGGCGAEIAGEVTLRVSVISGQQKPYPIVETEEKLIILASGKTLDEACEAAAEAFCDFLVSEMEFTSEDAVMLLSACGESFCVPGGKIHRRLWGCGFGKRLFFSTQQKNFYKHHLFIEVFHIYLQNRIHKTKPFPTYRFMESSASSVPKRSFLNAPHLLMSFASQMTPVPLPRFGM